jgi:hypothetical protein
MLVVSLADGRIVRRAARLVPAALARHTRSTAAWQLAAAGYGIHWPDIDEDLSVHGILAGVPAPAGHVALR